MQAEMEVACNVFSNGRVKIKELKSMSLEFYISVRTFYMTNMAGLIARVISCLLESFVFGVCSVKPSPCAVQATCCIQTMYSAHLHKRHLKVLLIL